MSVQSASWFDGLAAVWSGAVALWSGLVDALAVHAVAPALAFLHIAELSDDPHEIAGALMIAVVQVGLIAFVMRPLESLAPAERWTDRALTRVDRQYTLLMLLTLFPLFSFLVLTPFANYFGGVDGGEAGPPPLVRWMPFLDGHPYLLFAVYYLIYDFVYYWMHRAQHAIPWWWALHSMHHSQRQMSCWSNDRGSYLDGVLQSLILATVGLLIGVEPVEFALLMLIAELVQNFSHANVRFGFGPLFGRLLVDPLFHRLHHMRVDPDRPTLHNCNFGQVLPIWDQLFGTALYGEPIRPTGVGDPVVDADNGRGIVAMQWYTLKRFWGAVRCRAGWIPGDVAFGPDYRPIPTREIDLHALEAQPAPADARHPTAPPPLAPTVRVAG